MIRWTFTPIQFAFTFIISYFLLIHAAFGQNLIPDGSFEVVSYDLCERPDIAFKKMKHWYSLDATPDFFEGRCSFNENEFIFWSEDIRPYEGQNYAGLWSRWNSNDNYSSEGIAVELTSPLQAGEIYKVEMAIWNRGSYQGLENFGSCILEPDKHIDLYTSTDSIVIVNDFANGTSSTSAMLVSRLESEEITGDETDDWTVISTCFQAAGGERHFAIMMPLGTFGEIPLCVQTMATSGVFRSFYYHIDAVSLVPLDVSLTTQLLRCTDEDIDLNIEEIFMRPILSDASYLWDDGTSGPTNIISDNIENISVTATIDCIDIELDITFTYEDCRVNVYVPNVFSPKKTGENQTFRAFISNADKINQFDLKIYDRWGNVIFKSLEPSLEWNGNFNGTLVSTGVYSWVLSFQSQSSDQIKNEFFTGSVTIIH